MPKEINNQKRKVIYSDNAKTFKAGAQLLQKINKDEKWHHHLNKEQVTWKVNVPKAQWCVCVWWWWWGGGRGAGRTFKCLTTHSLYKSIGRSQLTYNELEEILLDVEINWNNHPLTYVDTSN